jgi:hypothetical protein
MHKQNSGFASGHTKLMPAGSNRQLAETAHEKMVALVRDPRLGNSVLCSYDGLLGNRVVCRH